MWFASAAVSNPLAHCYTGLHKAQELSVMSNPSTWHRTCVLRSPCMLSSTAGSLDHTPATDVSMDRVLTVQQHGVQHA